MADGPETQTTRPESTVFGAKLLGAGEAEDARVLAGRSGCIPTTTLRRQFVVNLRTLTEKHVTFCAKEPSFIQSWLRVPIRSRNSARPEAKWAECILGSVGSTETIAARKRAGQSVNAAHKEGLWFSFLWRFHIYIFWYGYPYCMKYEQVSL